MFTMDRTENYTEIAGYNTTHMITIIWACL